VLLRLVEPLAHRVHLVREHGDLVALAQVQRPGEVALADAPCLLGEPSHRLADEVEPEHDRHQPAEAGHHERDDGGAELGGVDVARLVGEGLGDLQGAAARAGHARGHVGVELAAAGAVALQHRDLLAALQPAELRAVHARARGIAGRPAQPDPADGEGALGDVGVGDEGVGARRAARLPGRRDGGRQRAPQHVLVAPHVALEELGLAAHTHPRVYRQHGRDGDGDGERELPREPHASGGSTSGAGQHSAGCFATALRFAPRARRPRVACRRVGAGTAPAAPRGGGPMRRYLEDDEEPLHHSRTSRRVLLAEDDPHMRALLASALRHDGLDVIEVADGTELFDYIGSSWSAAGSDGRPDLVITDVRMPGFTGLEILDILRQAEWGLPVILITAFGSAETHQLAHKLGAVAVFDKPFELDDLTTAALFYADAPSPPA
jgi:CheY-like chemotaxis protein